MATADSPSTSPTLLRLLTGPTNEAAWRQFVELYGPLIEDRCRRAGLQSADIEEVRSRVLTGLVIALREFVYDPARRFRGYLRVAVNNCVRNYWRERTRSPGAIGSGDCDAAEKVAQIEVPDPVAHLADELDDSLSQELLRAQRVLEQVRGQVELGTWEAYWRTAMEGETAAAVAHALGKSVAAVYMAKSRVGKLLLTEGARATNDQTPA